MLAPNEDLPFDPGDFLSTLPAGKTNLTFPSQAEIYAQGSPSDAVYFVLKGRIKLTAAMPDGKLAVMGIFGAGGFFGEGALAGHRQRKVTITAVEETSVIRVEADAMKQALRDAPRFSEYFITYLINRKIRTEFDLVDQIVNPSEKRLARVLLQLAEAGEGGESRNVSIKISQETLADMIGTTRSRVSFFMNKFRRLGYIEYKGKLRIHRSLLTEVLRDP